MSGPQHEASCVDVKPEFTKLPDPSVVKMLPFGIGTFLTNEESILLELNNVVVLIAESLIPVTISLQHFCKSVSVIPEDTISP